MKTSKKGFKKSLLTITSIFLALNLYSLPTYSATDINSTTVSGSIIQIGTAQPQSIIPLASEQQTAAYKVNINTASAEELAEYLNGIGVKKAQKIIEYREANGAFTSLEQLMEVNGIGQTIYNRNADKMSL